jgi:charged multivesicular body protein 7
VDKDDALEERAITSVDRGILELKTAVHSMHLQIDSVQEKIDQYVDFGLLHRVTGD